MFGLVEKSECGVEWMQSVENEGVENAECKNIQKKKIQKYIQV